VDGQPQVLVFQFMMRFLVLSQVLQLVLLPEQVRQLPLQASQLPVFVLKNWLFGQAQLAGGVPPNLQVKQLLLFEPSQVPQVP
jgi:hypothetical protein